MFDENGEEMQPTELKHLSFNREIEPVVFSIYSSTLFYLYTYTFSDCRNINNPEIENFRIEIAAMEAEIFSRLADLSVQLDLDLQKNARMLEYNYSTGLRRFQAFYPRHSKHIIDEIDRVLARHYGFTDEELDYIINYDIKYRMGLVGGDAADEDGE